jgi:hypothetical protein
MAADAAARIAHTAAIDGHFARLHVVAPAARLDVIAALTGARVAAVHDLDEEQGARAVFLLASCLARPDLPALVGRLEREAAYVTRTDTNLTGNRNYESQGES